MNAQENQVENTQDYYLHAKKLPVTLCPLTYCPMQNLFVKLSIPYECQHDGHSWSMEEVKRHEAELAENIMVELREKVRGFIEEMNPYGCHHFPEGHK
jgi:hypothetical protein